MQIEVLGKKYEAEEEYEPIFVDGREYIPLKIYKKNNELKDMYLCVDVKTGHKECFHRMDKGREPKKVKMSDSVNWTSEENKIINNAIEKGLTPGEASEIEELNRHTKRAIMTRFCETKRQKRMKKEMELEKRKQPRFNIKF